MALLCVKYDDINGNTPQLGMWQYILWATFLMTEYEYPCCFDADGAYFQQQNISKKPNVIGHNFVSFAIL